MSLSISALKATRAFFLSRVCLSLYEPATTYRFPQDVHGPSSSGEPRALFAAQEEAGSCASRAIYANCVYGFIHIIHRYTAIHPSLHIIHTSTHVQYSTSTTHTYTHTHTHAILWFCSQGQWLLFSEQLHFASQQSHVSLPWVADHPEVFTDRAFAGAAAQASRPSPPHPRKDTSSPEPADYDSGHADSADDEGNLQDDWSAGQAGKQSNFRNMIVTRERHSCSFLWNVPVQIVRYR